MGDYYRLKPDGSRNEWWRRDLDKRTCTRCGEEWTADEAAEYGFDYQPRWLCPACHLDNVLDMKRQLSEAFAGMTFDEIMAMHRLPSSRIAPPPTEP